MANFTAIFLFCFACQIHGQLQCNQGQGEDMTLQLNAVGADVVRAVLSKLDHPDLFEDTTQGRELYELFIREAAYVESLDGAENSPDRHEGGIWRVSMEIFQQTQQYNSTEVFHCINHLFCINWMDAQYSDLNIPLYSGIAINIYLHFVYDQRLQDNATDIDNARFWLTSFGETSRSDDKWIMRTDELRRTTTCRVNTDVVFVLDSSESIGPDNFQIMKDYVYNFTESLLSGNSDSRMGVITYSDRARVEIELADRERQTLLEEIQNLTYIGKNTNTPEALCQLKLRPWRDNITVLRIAIVMTDGVSNGVSTKCNRSEPRNGTPSDNGSEPGTLNSTADEVHNFRPRITVFAVGLLPDTTLEELRTIASDRQLIDSLSSFDFRRLQRNQRSRSYFICFKASQKLVINEQSNGQATQSRSTTVSVQDGVTVRICIHQGAIFIYGSYTVQDPSPSLNDFSFFLNATNGNTMAGSNCKAILAMIDGSIISGQCRTTSGRRRRQSEEEETASVYITIEGVSERENHFSVDTSFGEAFECAADSCVGQYEMLNRRNGICSCECAPGYERQGQECTNIDECIVMPDLCGENGVCTDTSGSYTCGCLEGYADLEEELCSNIDECTVMPDLCGENGVCTDTSGSYTCGCQEGYKREAELCSKADRVGKVTLFVIGVCCAIVVVVLLLVLAMVVIVYMDLKCLQQTK